MLSSMPFTPRHAIFYAIYPKLCYRLCHIPRSSAIFFLNVMLQYITLTPSYANSSYAMFSGQSRGRISGYCCMYIKPLKKDDFPKSQLFAIQKNFFGPLCLARHNKCHWQPFNLRLDFWKWRSWEMKVCFKP